MNISIVVANRTDTLYTDFHINTNCWSPPQFPLGPGYLAAYLEQEGFDVSVFDNYLHKDSPSTAAKKILTHNPRCVGISINSLTIRDGLDIAREIKRLQPDCLIVMGGPHATLFPKRTLADKNVDVVIAGEGEYAFKELLTYSKKFTPSTRPQKIIHAPRISNLDALPMPARHLFEFNSYNRICDVIKDIKPADQLSSSRGCPFSCSFCSSALLWERKYFTRSAQKVVAEMQHLIEVYGSKALYFREDNFTCKRSHVEGICHAIIDAGLNVPWECESRVDTLDPDLINLMRRAGCESIWFGVESGSQRILGEISKGITLEQVRNVFRWCKDEGIRTGAMFMIGFPDETLEEMQQTRDFAFELSPDFASVAVFVGYPNSSLYNYYKEHKALIKANHEDILIVNSHNFSFEELASIEQGFLADFRAAGM